MTISARIREALTERNGQTVRELAAALSEPVLKTGFIVRKLLFLDQVSQTGARMEARFWLVRVPEPRRTPEELRAAQREREERYRQRHAKPALRRASVPKLEKPQFELSPAKHKAESAKHRLLPAVPLVAPSPPVRVVRVETIAEWQARTGRPIEVIPGFNPPPMTVMPARQSFRGAGAVG
jgi:hypothetical protein